MSIGVPKKENERPTKLYLHLKKWLEIAVLDYGMIQEGDKILVGVSGGSDSMALLALLGSPMVFLPSFSLLAVNVDLGFEETYRDFDVLETYFKENRYDYVMIKTDIGPLSHSDHNRKKPCFLCSRLRRKQLFEIADEYGCNKIAFAHHKDDIIETLLLNLFYAREISTMLPNQPIFQGNIHIIRPLAYIRENLIKKYAKERNFPVIENRCPTSKTSQRIFIKNLLNELETGNKNIRENIFKAMYNLKPEYLLKKPDISRRIKNQGA